MVVFVVCVFPVTVWNCMTDLNVDIDRSGGGQWACCCLKVIVFAMLLQTF